MDEKGETLWNWYYKDNVVHFVNGSLQGPISAVTPVEVRLTNNSDSWAALATTSLFLTDTWTVDKLTLNLGVRFDRYRVYTPEQQLAAGRFVPTPLTFAAVDKIVGFNHLVPRLGAHLRPDGRRQDRAEGELGPLLLQPRHHAGRRGQPQHRQPVRRSRVERPQRRSDLPGRRAGHADPEVRRRRQRVDRSEHPQLVHGRSVVLRRARGDHRPRHPRRLRVEEGQRRLAAGQRVAAARATSTSRPPSSIPAPTACTATATTARSRRST